MRPWLKFFRVPLLPTVWSHLAAVALVTGTWPDPSAFVAFSCLYLWGMGANDWADRALDELGNPTRPLPAGDIAPARAARALVLVLVGLALSIVMIPEPSVRWACATGLLAATAYDFGLKHHRFAGALSMAVVRASVIAGFDVPRPMVWILGAYVLGVTLWSTTEEADPRRKKVTLRLLLALPLLDALQVTLWSGGALQTLGFLVISLACLGLVTLLRPSAVESRPGRER